ncbi:MAG: protein-disulfide reductase DsbD domain-containing protein, partial [Hyphomicrobium sp.]
MKHVHLVGLCLWLGLLSAPTSVEAATGLASDWVEGHSSRARLIAGNGMAGVEVEMPEGWKTYWRTPGDAGGVPPSFDWSKSENLAAATVLYPAPKRFSDRAGDTVGYKGTVVFPVRLTAKDPGKPIDLRLSLEYGVCKEICIPAEA